MASSLAVSTSSSSRSKLTRYPVSQPTLTRAPTMIDTGLKLFAIPSLDGIAFSAEAEASSESYDLALRLTVR